jgi:membrane protein implicated in regulation of membrane protease activity
MDDDSGRPKRILLTVILILVGGFLITAAVLARDSIGTFTSWLLIITALVIALAVTALWRRHRNQRSR